MLTPPHPTSATEAREEVLRLHSEHQARIKLYVAREADLEQKYLFAQDQAGKRRPRPAIADVAFRLADELNTAGMERGAYQDQAAQQLRSLLYVDQSSSFVVQWDSSIADEERAIWEPGFELARRFIGVRSLDGVRVYVTKGHAGRSGYVGKAHGVSPKIIFGPAADARTAAHEIGHFLDEHDPAILSKALEFYARRTQGEPLIALQSIDSAYQPDERTRKDKFRPPYYMGKDPYRANGKVYTTEVVTEGLANFYEDPAGLASEDPEAFEFIYDLLRGQ